MKQRQLNIAELLRATDHCDGGWLSRQPAGAQKEFAPLPAMRWVATVNDGPASEYMLWMVNDRVNRRLFDYGAKHPELAFRLLASCGLDKTLKHQWVAGPRRKLATNAAATLLLEFNPDLSDAELELLLSQFDRAEFIAFLDGCGLQPSDAKDNARKKEALKAFDLAIEQSAPR